MRDEALLELAAGLARQAAAAILAVRDAGFAVEAKRDRSPVTEADRIAEALIVEGLRAATPTIPVIAEEEVEAGIVTAPSGLFWLVDPLDGTRDFAAGRAGYAVNIGLVRRGAPVLGAVALPETGELFLGAPGLGAWKEGGEGGAARRPIAVRRAPPPEGLVVMAGFHAPGEAAPLEEFLAGRKVARIIRIGSAQKLLRVAEGTADLFPRFARTMEWDTAAPQAVLEAAGGSAMLWDGGGRLRYGKPGWRNPGFLASAGAA